MIKTRYSRGDMNKFTVNDLHQIAAMGKSLAKVEEELEYYRRPLAFLDIVDAANVKNGAIKVFSEEKIASLLAAYKDYTDLSTIKFIPASGAASRMFKDMFKALEKLEKGESLSKDDPAYILAEHIQDFAFYDKDLFHYDGSDESVKAILTNLLTDSGLAYGKKPKAVIKFHRYADEIRTALAEHFVEARAYLKPKNDVYKLVISISPEHKDLFSKEIAKIKGYYEKKYNCKYDIELTYQDIATDTLAVDKDNKVFRKSDNTLLFRPAGHGALIYNLNKLDADFISIKNIDNVAHEGLLAINAKYKLVLMSYCMDLRTRVFKLLNDFDNNLDKERWATEAENLLRDEFCITLSENADSNERLRLLRDKLNRPIRVCGMVKNTGEAGGGPFIVRNGDASTNLQILESVQLNMDDIRHRNSLKEASHFNPVDLLCSVKDYRGKKFDLLNYVDPNTSFISSKTYEGRDLKALELPGLWNGAMSDWNTAFVEVPIETFNPVKLVLDLLRKEHQSYV